MTRYGKTLAGAAPTVVDAQTTAFSELAPADPGRLGILIYNPTANGILSLNWDGSANTAYEVAAGASFTVPEVLAALQMFGKVATNGNVNVTSAR